eukprot:SAG11_NODE_36303_length_262_cov_0.834356_1_plen_39_part_10
MAEGRAAGGRGQRKAKLAETKISRGGSVPICAAAAAAKA